MPTLKDSVNNVVANLAPIKADTEAAGKFARNFQEPMRELLGRTPEGTYDEGKFILRNMAHIIFSLSGLDKHGAPKDGATDKLGALLTHYFNRHHLQNDGAKKEPFFVFWYSLWDYCTSSIWHRIFDVIIAIVIWLVILNPAGTAIKNAVTALQKVTIEKTLQKP